MGEWNGASPHGIAHDMTAGRQPVFQRLRQVALAQEGGPTDGELMERFTARRDADALEALIRRHGPMVLAVCRRVLGNEADAEDAFQAAFLVFVRKAASIRARELVGSWLYGVAYRTAQKAKGAAARRRMQERRAATMNPKQAESDEDWAELLPLLDRELSRLPERYRTAVVLCELEGRSRKEAARKLGVPEGTLSSRLATGKRMLARRLARHGPAPSAGALAAALARGAGVPSLLLASTTKAASLLAAGRAATAVASSRVAALAEGVLKSMLLTKLSVAFVAAVAVVALGAAVFACRALAAPPVAPAVALTAPAPPEEKRDVKKEQPEWGEAVDGVQARLRPGKLAWDEGEKPWFSLDLRNRGEKALHGCREYGFCEIEWDGQWYWMPIRGALPNLGAGDPRNQRDDSWLAAGKQIDEWVKASPEYDAWFRKMPDGTPEDAGADKGLGLPPEGKPKAASGDLQVSAGKHTMRVAFVFLDGGPRPVSQTVEIEVGEESAWGDADGGVQARVRTPKAVWGAKEAPTFLVDLQNVSEKTTYTLHGPLPCCEIEVDGTWYICKGVDSVFSGDTKLEPGKQCNGWVTVTPDKTWMEKGAMAEPPPRLQWRPGKHAVRIACWLWGEKPLLRPMSEPIQVEIRQEG
jgi:RNA polymerase sigma factor (sigma-70 family)